jgi:hypothetical protein
LEKMGIPGPARKSRTRKSGRPAFGRG